VSLASDDLVTLNALRQQFPALENKAYFNYGGQGPMPQAALEAIQQAHWQIQRDGPFCGQVNRWLQQQAEATRQLMAAELGCPATAITLTEDVTVGCNIPLWGLEWQAGDHILLSDCEHPGVIAAVREVCRRFGVETSQFSLLEGLDQRSPVEAMAAQLRPRTRLLVISHLTWNTGQVLPLADMVRCCHGRPEPVWVLVDAAQSVGSLPLNLTELGVDFYAFTGHKWWCGPAGLGGLYVRPALCDRIPPTFIGWRGITTDDQGQPTGWKPSAQRYEVATSDYALQAGLQAALQLHQQWGSASDRYQRICQLSHYLWQQLQTLPQIRCLRQVSPESGLVSFQIWQDGQPSPAHHGTLVQTLETQGFMLRTLLFPHCVRACVHYFTTEAEIDQLVEAIKTTCP